MCPHLLRPCEVLPHGRIAAGAPWLHKNTAVGIDHVEGEGSIAAPALPVALSSSAAPARDTRPTGAASTVAALDIQTASPTEAEIGGARHSHPRHGLHDKHCVQGGCLLHAAAMRMLPDLIDGGSYNSDQDDSGCSDDSEHFYNFVRTPHYCLPD